MHDDHALSGKHSANVLLGCLLSECSLSLASVLVQMNVCEHGTTRAHRQWAGCCSAPCMCPQHDTLIGTHRQAHNTLDVLGCRVHFQLAALVGACGLIQVALPLRATRHTRQLAVSYGAAARTHCMPRRMQKTRTFMADFWALPPPMVTRGSQQDASVRGPVKGRAFSVVAAFDNRVWGVGCCACFSAFAEHAPHSSAVGRALSPVNAP